MAIDTKRHLLVNSLTGDIISDATYVAPELQGAAMYDLAGDIEAIAEYAETHGTELYAPGDDEVGEYVSVAELDAFIAIDLDSGQVLTPSSLRLVDVAAVAELDVEDLEAMKEVASSGLVPEVSTDVNALEGLAFEDVNE